ncbi:MAG: glycosyltransferase family 2 protein [Chloroflexota bacterium]
MASVCGAVIARDAEATIARCLNSLLWTDSLLVVLDDRTIDSTGSIASSLGAKVESRTFVDFARQRNTALDLIEDEWVLFVDADEVVTPELAAEVRAVTTASNRIEVGYWIPRRNIIFGRWIRNAGWSPDYQLRLLKKSRARYREDRIVHELVDLQGEAGYLDNPFIHYNYATFSEFLDRQRRYASFEAANRYRRGLRARPHNYLLQPWREFWRRYIQLKGYKEGFIGLLLSATLAYYEFKTYVELSSISTADRCNFS